ncbi:MAG: hypothetical protein KDK64_02070, partial [Chlamydiia bacterium]|nr:hypothetical protein [Chlamydiia bacterium]
MTLDLVKGSQGVYQSFGNQLVPLSSHLSVTEDGLKLVVAAQKLAADKLQSPCVITDLFSSNRTDWQVTAHTHLGQVYQIKLSESAITHEIASINALNVSFLPALETNTPSYLDGFSLAATHYFKSHPVSESQLFSWKYTGPRVVLRDGRIQIKKGYPKAQIPIRHLYQREDMKRREEENQETIRVYVEFLTREIGERKLQEIQRTYGFDFKTIKYLEPKHIYLCNIGMNNIEHRDVIDLKKRISTWIQSHDDLNVPLLGEGHPFTNREVRGLIRLLGRDATLRDLAAAFPSEETNLNQLVKVLETSKRAQERMYTGRKFEAQIQGSYNREVSDSSTPRPWVDQQELLQVFETLKNPFPGEKVSRQKLDRFFFEMLTKVVVKKHLMRSEGSEGSRDGTWRVGALIPSPYRNAKGETVYYRVDQGVDSGHGKLWIVLRPAREDADPSLPVIRVPRDTCPSLYTQRGGPTFTRDLAENAGYHNSATTFEEDREFFKEFTLPLWMAHFATALMHYKEAKKTQDYSQLDEPISNTYKELIGNLIAKAQTGKLDPEVKDKIKNALTPYYLDFKKQKGENKLIAAQKFISVLLHVAPYDADDFNRLHHLLQGNPPRPVASIGNSLGGFDAQQDLFAHTFRSGRVPVT